MLIDHSAYIYLSSDSVVYGANQKHDNADVSDIITLYCFVAVSDHRRYISTTFVIVRQLSTFLKPKHVFFALMAFI